MISRAHMRRQLRAKGGITDVVQRTNYLFGGIKDRIRKLIPNEIADVAVKAAPLVAMIPGQQGTAALMRGIGRFDQRGSISDALKQGALTYAGGKLFGAGMEKIGLRDPGASGIGEFFNEGTRSKAGSLFSRQTTDSAFKKPNIKDITDGSKSLLSGTRDLIKSGFKALPKGVAAQLAAGGITAGASLLASYFQGDFREQEPGETMEDYLAARKVAVGKQMRTYMDSYFKFDPEYSALDDAGRDMFVARYNVKDGGRIEYQTGGISSANTLAENIARNRAAQSAFQQAINPSQQRVVERLQKMNPAGTGNIIQGVKDFGDHARVSEAMAGKINMPVIPEYGMQTGYDFQTKMAGLDPRISSALAKGYQYAQEGARAVLDGPGGVTLGQAMETAKKQSDQNIEGIMSAASKQGLTAKQQADRNKYLASQGQPTETMTAATPTQDDKIYINSEGTVTEKPNYIPGTTYNYRGDVLHLGDDPAANLSEALRKRYPKSLLKPTMADVAGPAYKPGFENYRFDFKSDDSPLKDKLLTDVIPDLDKFGNYIGDDPLLKDYAAAGRGTAYSNLTKLPADNPAAEYGAGYYTFNGTNFTKVADENPTPEYMKFLRSQYLPGLASKQEFSMPTNAMPNYEGGSMIAPDLYLGPTGIYEQLFEGNFRSMGRTDPRTQGLMASGGRVGLMGGAMPTGIMRSNKAGVMERDYRDKGGFVPVGIKEKADDVPAMLSKNEFVMTANAVRGAGNGSIEKGAQRMYDTMKRLEKRAV